MEWMAALSPEGDRGYNACLVLAERYRNTPVLIPCHKDEKAMATAMIIWIQVIIHIVSFQNIMSDRDTKFISALWTNIHNIFGTEQSLSTAYHPHFDG
ncbi:hypothetical protein O181_005717 [Austropuccinia psidii MF-1]|uniref:Integrase catalytic domain-containing protein n=1 Tax=Austropuccinia psidii MF-1 TaxID=1389203 RepID=A0A9Q3GGX9_9BASI|nr:hypothetical protein [Austropuccinia psidii MF-1]